MDKLKQKFIEEASEHVAEIEQSLLLLENDPDNPDLIEKIFRAMHTLKGAGSMFGFEKISDLTHNVENIYDLIRNGKLPFTRNIADLTLGASDLIRLIISEENQSEPATLEKYENMKEVVSNILSEISKGNATIMDEKAIDESLMATYYIYFKPGINIFNNGTNPLYLVEELAGMGKSFVLVHQENIPDLENLDPEYCYTSWEIVLAAETSVKTIREVFIFVEDSAEIEIQELSKKDLFENKKFLRKLEKFIPGTNEIGFDQFKVLAESSDQSVANKLKKALGDDYKKTVRDYSISSIRVASEKLDHLMNLVSEMVTTQARLSLYVEHESSGELTTINENIQKLSRQLRDLAFEIVLVPIDTIIIRYQRLVRDLSKELNKMVVFQATGTETELDKTVIENLTDPLMHIIRNCIDHGIELPDERISKGKPAEGKIQLNAFHSGTNVHIEIQDDGRGIDVEKIRTKALQKGLIHDEANLSDRQLYDLLFLPGFSTAENVTDVSGRGVGMDVVRQKIANIRGEIQVESQKDLGTKITLKIPITLSIIDGLLVEVDKTNYIIPLISVSKIYSIDHSAIENKFNNYIVLDEERIPFFYLREEFEAAKNTEGQEQVIVIQYENQKVGLVADAVVGEYQAVLKPLGKHYRNQQIVSAATILGDGTVALVIDTNRAINYFSKLITVEESL